MCEEIEMLQEHKEGLYIDEKELYVSGFLSLLYFLLFFPAGFQTREELKTYEWGERNPYAIV